MATETERETALTAYEELDKKKQTIVDRARQSASVTIPYVFRDATATDQEDLDREYVQTYGAQAVNHLVGKFALAILPPSQPFFRLSPTPEAVAALTSDDPKHKEEMEKRLAVREEEINRHIGQTRFGEKLYQILRLALITGDVLVEKMDVGYRVFNLNNYVIKRDPAGKIVDLCIKEELEYATVPKEIQSTIPDDKKEDTIYVYTRCVLNGDTKKYDVYQEVNEEIVAGSEESLTNITERFMSVRWNKIDGEHYGRGFVEEHMTLFIPLNKNLRVVTEGGAQSAKIVYAVNPNGFTDFDDFLDAPNGGAIVGSENDITTIKVDKGADLRVTKEIVDDMQRSLMKVFLVASESVRDSERTTAYEVQQVASDLEAAFGGIYTSISTDIQRPLVENSMKKLKLKAEKDIDVMITTGVAALGRNIEAQRVGSLLGEIGGLAQLVGPEAIAQKLNTSAILSSMVANSGIASKDFVLSDEVVGAKQANDKQEQMSQMALEQGIPQATEQAIAAQGQPAQ